MMKKSILFFTVLILLLLTTVTKHNDVYGDHNLTEKRVLFISSYSSSFPTFFQQIEGLKEGFSEYPIVLDVEFMDSKRYFTEENLENFKDSITYKLLQVDYDLVITSDDNAINFVMEHRDELFGELPIIFFGVNNETNALTYSQEPGVTGIVEDISIEDTIDLALSLNPEATNIIALVDNTVSGQSDLTRFYDVQPQYPDYEFKKIDMSELTRTEFLSEISLVSDDSVMILFSALKDVNGTSYEFDDSVEDIVIRANQPVYHLFEHGIAEGLIGGRVVSHHSQGKSAALLAIDYFNGEYIDDILLVDESPNVYIINYEVFEKFNYSKNALPDNTQFINREYTLFEQYTAYFLIGIGFLVVQTIIIIALVLSVRNRNQARLEVIKSKAKLENAFNELETVNDQLEYKSYHDDLTGLFNRNYFEEQYPKITNLDYDIPVSIILLDVNGLKLINDAFGHISGDKVLVETANLLMKLFVNSDIFRIGGDEFAIIPYGKSEKTVNLLIDKLNREIQKIKVEGITLSVSIGYAYLTETKTLREMFTEAEDWMYREKLNHVPSNRSSIIEAIKATIYQKDSYSEAHSTRVSEIAVKISKLMKLSENITGEIKTAGLLHDIGKIIVPSDILNKTGKLSSEEYLELKKHSEIGYRILNSVSSMRDIAEYVFCHHERPDGLGYPRGLKGDQIPIQSRIIAIADAIDAMLTDRKYRKKLSKEVCYKELEQHSGSQFCRKTMKIVLKNYDEIYDFVNEISS